MKNANAGAAIRVHRSAASEANWKEWISEPVGAQSTLDNARPPARVNGAHHASHEAIARLAYAIWEQRGCPHGSPEEDWFRAEQLLLRQ